MVKGGENKDQWFEVTGITKEKIEGKNKIKSDIH
jgi:hypothetical protein